MAGGFSRTTVAAAVAGVVVAFGVGVLVGRLSPNHPAAPASTGFSWPFFGKPRGAEAGRPAVVSPTDSPSGPPASTPAAPSPWPASG